MMITSVLIVTVVILWGVVAIVCCLGGSILAKRKEGMKINDIEKS